MASNGNGNGSSIHERAGRPQPAPDAQDGMFDKQWEHTDLEAALERREVAKDVRSSAVKDFKVADDIVKGYLAGFDLAVGEVARIGRFRIQKTKRDGNSIAFDTAPSERLSIDVD